MLPEEHVFDPYTSEKC